MDFLYGCARVLLVPLNSPPIVEYGQHGVRITPAVASPNPARKLRARAVLLDVPSRILTTDGRLCTI